MGKPNTRSKHKRQKIDENEEVSSIILRKIFSTGEISRDHVHVLYMINKPYCQGCRVNSKESPNCFCALVPPTNGSRKSGLWQKLTDTVEEFGSDPCKDTRTSIEFPAGLTNLGATCYVNSILQCLYMNGSFRSGVLSVEPELLAQEVVIDKLAHLFAQLHSSRMAYVDSAPFVTTLELDNSAQQDSHEFFTLLLSLLERSLSHSKVPKARTIVRDVFCGTMSHVTWCSVCGKESDASSKKEDFYGLELNIKGLNHLEESLDDYFKVEELQGENQYFCESCQKHVDATHSIILHALPSVLNFQLKRYVFLAKTTTRKKLNSIFSFPRLLTMTERLCESDKLESVYELTAILVHKGTAVNSGHYVAHIKHEHSGCWWKFDDEHVSELGSNPFGEKSLGSTKCKTQAIAQSVCSEKECSTSEGGLANNNEVFSSADAYMLMYSRQCTEGISTSGMDLDMNGCESLPAHLFDEVKQLNASLAASSENYVKRKQAEVENITSRREEVRSILSEVTVQASDDPFFWVSTEWFRLWAETINPPPIDNTTIQCMHNKVSLSKNCSMKRLSEKAWHKLFGKYGGGPELAHDDYCVICLKDEAKSTVSANNFKELRSSMMELAEAALAGNFSHEHMYYVSKAWLLQWVRRKNIDSPSEADSGPTASLSCPHGELLPEQAAGAKRVLVPNDLWLFFLENAKAVKPDDLSGCIAFPMGAESCAICCVELNEMASLENNLRGEKLKQRQNHEKLFQNKSISLFPGCKYFILPSSWLTKWRAYIASGKNAFSHLEPDLLTVMESLICQKHSCLLERPPQLACKRGVITQKSSMDGLTLILESDWKAFCEEWSVPVDKGVTAEIDLVNTRDLCGSSAGMLAHEGLIDPAKTEVENGNESKQPVIRTRPETCEDCIGERETCNLMQKLNYCNEEIQVFLIHGNEVPKSILEASGNSFDLDRRTSKRSRRTSGGNSVSLKVSGSTTFYQLKMMIWESFGVVKENQKLHKGTKEFEGEIATLADMNIFPGDVLWVTDSEIHENRDIADELSEQKMDLQQIEEGFRGTLLVPNITSQTIAAANDGQVRANL